VRRPRERRDGTTEDTENVTLNAADLSGRWTLDLEPDFSGHPATIDCSISQSETKLAVDCGTTATLTGSLDEAATTIAGKWHLDPGDQSGEFELKKAR
jgi:hypothetical protein